MVGNSVRIAMANFLHDILSVLGHLRRPLTAVVVLRHHLRLAIFLGYHLIIGLIANHLGEEKDFLDTSVVYILVTGQDSHDVCNFKKSSQKFLFINGKKVIVIFFEDVDFNFTRK